MYKKITAGAFVLSLILFFVLVFLFPTDERASVQENRPLKEMPALTLTTLFSGEFGEEFEEYLSDNVGYRSRFTALGAKIEKLRGIVSNQDGQIIDLANGTQLALHDGKIMEIFRQNPSVQTAYTAVLNSYADILPADTNMYLMLVPTQIEFDQSSYRTVSDSQKETIDSIYGALSGIACVNVYDRLAANSDAYIYFRTDHHWTQRGAYLGYAALMEAVGEQAIPLSSMAADRRGGFLGYLYNQANVSEYAKFVDEIEFFCPGENYAVRARALENGEFVDYTTKLYSVPAEGAPTVYALFMGGDHAFAEINTAVGNGKTALVLKDSYANALIPLLTSHYETILVLDPRSYYGTVSDLLAERRIDDIFVINYTMTTTFSDFVANLERIR